MKNVRKEIKKQEDVERKEKGKKKKKRKNKRQLMKKEKKWALHAILYSCQVSIIF